MENKHKQQLHKIEDHISFLEQLTAPQKWYYDKKVFNTFEKLKEYMEGKEGKKLSDEEIMNKLNSRNPFSST